jgi:hypothetical protein
MNINESLETLIMRKGQKLVVLGLAVAAFAMPRVLPAKEIAESSKLSVSLLQGGSDDIITGRTDFSSKNGKSSFRLRIKGGPSNSELELKVGGVSRGTFTTSKSGSASIQFRSGSSSGNSRLLDFDPRSELIEIEDIGDDKLLTSEGSDDSRSIDERSNLVSTGVQPGASGHATLRQKNGAAQFNVEVEDVTDGAYDVIVDGVTRGTINVTGGRGEIQFGDDNGGPTLDFDPLGKLIQISQTGTVILSGTLLAGAPGVSVCTPAETITVLTNLGLDPDASGDARLRVRDDCVRDFRVEVEDLPVGAYDLAVAGIIRGTIDVATQPDLSVRGEIEFSSQPDDSPSTELPLEFDPAGQTVEIKQGTNVFLSATTGTPSTGTCVVVDTELDMTNTGADADAKGKSRVRQDLSCRRNLRVEVEKLALGDYELAVGGIVRGTITVALVLGEPVGQIEFDTEPDQPGEILLTFDPRGQLVEVRQGATVLLNVTMPE